MTLSSRTAALRQARPRYDTLRTVAIAIGLGLLAAGFAWAMPVAVVGAFVLGLTMSRDPAFAYLEGYQDGAVQGEALATTARDEHARGRRPALDRDDPADEPRAAVGLRDADQRAARADGDTEPATSPELARVLERNTRPARRILDDAGRPLAGDGPKRTPFAELPTESAGVGVAATIPAARPSTRRAHRAGNGQSPEQEERT